MPIQLELKKQIDAICDRFELAWDADERPRIEQYLELLSGEGRRPLLAELLASELSLRRQTGETCDRAEYAGRFSQDRDLVDLVFSRRPTPAGQKAFAGEPYLDIVRALQACQAAGASMTAVYVSEEHLRGLAERLRRYASQNRDAVDGALEEQLWLAIFRACRQRGALDAGNARAVTGDLLAVFPPARQAILVNVLLGNAGSAAGRADAVTQRTVTSTVSVAVKLLR
ncbi:MAG TPA: hypothetical protein VHY91_01535 [Pirellulales bacterium]|jgi:hypothetical protein|nr:hypothetical protein [Pirellulales bacterium]